MSIDVSDQLSSYNSALRRCTKWYRKVMIELIWGTSLVNAYFLYSKNSVNGKQMTITEFREEVIMYMVSSSSPKEAQGKYQTANSVHLLVVNKKGEKSVKGRCVTCYENLGRSGTIVAGKLKRAPQVVTTCSGCPKKPFMCKDCYYKTH